MTARRRAKSRLKTVAGDGVVKPPPQHGWKAANDNEKTFDAAAGSYLRMGGSQRYVAPVVEYFRGRLVATIVSAEVRQMGLEVFPGCKAATINRQALTPARAILNHAHELGWCSAIRVRSFKTEKPVKLPAVNGEWMSKFISQADADGLCHLSAIVFFMQDCAARVSEACNVLGEHVDIRNKTIRLAKTKTETNAIAYLTDECAYRIAHLPLKEG